jgi:hypothetical protein
LVARSESFPVWSIDAPRARRDNRKVVAVEIEVDLILNEAADGVAAAVGSGCMISL